MKQLLLLFLSIALFAFNISAQCPAGSVNLQGQIQVDNFPVTYPGCDKITGSLTIGGPNGTIPISNLNGLALITEVTGNFSIGTSGIDSNFTPSAMSALKKIGGNFKGPGGGVSCSLDALEEVGGNFEILNSSRLESLGFPKLTYIGGDIVIKGNDRLQSLGGLWNVQSLGLYSSIYIIGNWDYTGTPDVYSGLYDFNTGFQFLHKIPGRLVLDYNLNFHEIDGLNSLDTIGGTFHLNRVPYLKNLNPLQSLEHIGGSFLITTQQIGSNPSDYPDSLKSLGLLSLASIGDSLVIDHCRHLPALDGLGDLNSIGGPVFIQYNNRLTDISSLGGLSRLEEELTIHGNASLASLDGLDNIESIGGFTKITNNPSLNSFSGLSSLRSIGGGLSLAGFKAKTANGLNNLEEVLGEVQLTTLDSMTDLTALLSLTSIAGVLDLSGAPYLTSLRGLDNIDATTMTGVDISGMNRLSECDVKSICDFLSLNQGSFYVGAWGSTGYLATGCGSKAQIIAECAAGPNAVEAIDENSDLVVYPNPCSTCNVTGVNNPNAIEITSLLGERINAAYSKSALGYQITFPAESNGVYFIRNAETGDSTRFIKLN